MGVGVAVSGVADVSYLHECSPIEWRGSIVSVNEACISLGFLLAYIAGYVYADDGAEEWRIIFGMAGVLATIQFIGMLLHSSMRKNCFQNLSNRATIGRPCTFLSISTTSSHTTCFCEI